MKRNRPALLSLAIALALLIGLGSAFAGNSPVAYAAGDATLSVAHFAPFAADAADTSVTVRVNSSDLITEFVFPEVVSNLVVPAGTYTIEIIPTGSDTPVLTETVELAADTAYFAAAVGDGASYDLGLYPLVIDTTPSASAAKLRVTHLAPFLSPKVATAVDICTDAGEPVITALEYLSTTGYVELPPAVYNLKVAVSGTDCVQAPLDLPPFQLRAGQIVDVFARGLLAPADPDLAIGIYVMGPANVSVAHFAPFAATAAATSVTVRVDGEDVLTDFVFPDVTPFVSLPMGERFIEVIPTGASEAAISATVTLEPLVDYFVAAVGGNGYELGLYPQIVDLQPATDTAKLRVTHLAPFISPKTATAVDICTDAGEPVITALEYLSTTGYVNLPPAVYDLKVTVAGTECEQLALNLAPFQLRSGQIVDVVARGLLAPAPEVAAAEFDPALALGLYIMGPGNVAVAHFAPFAESVAGTAVTVRVDGVDVLTDFTFPSITPYVSLPMGERYVEIIPAGGSEPVITGTLDVQPLVDYTVAAIGYITDDADLGLGLQVYVDDNVTPPPAGQARVRAAHLAPFADTLAGTAVDLCAVGGSTPVLDDVLYKQDATLDLPAGLLPTYLSGPDPDCGPAVFKLPVVVLAEDDIVYLYVVGGRNGLPLQVASPAVTVAQTTYMPVVEISATPAE